MGKFFEKVEIWTGNTEEAISKIDRTSKLEVFSRVILRTPVDKGIARGGWSVNQRLSDGPADRSGTVTIEAMSAAVQRTIPGEITSLVNVVSYIEDLEFGHSDQAPNGMVRVVALEWPDIVKAAAAEFQVR